MTDYIEGESYCQDSCDDEGRTVSWAIIFQVCGQRSLDAIKMELVDHLKFDVRTKSPYQQRDTAKGGLRERSSLL